MRLVRVRAPEGKGADVAQLAFQAGIAQVSIHQEQTLKQTGERENKDVVDIETATPTAKAFTDALLAADFYDPQQFSFNVRHPRAIVSQESAREITLPLVEPSTDVYEELWQFSHITYGFVGRVLIAGLLLAYGIIEDRTLVIIAGLLFLPLLPLKLAISFGALTKEWRLAGQGLLAFVVAIVLLVASGSLVALVTRPPIKFDDFSSLTVAFLISLGVGVAAGLASADDVGRREMIGLAATAQVAILPVWFGVCFVFGFPVMDTATPGRRALTFAVNVVTIIVAALLTYGLMGLRGQGLRRHKAGAEK